jgi:asparagine synthase (glutamine-hydrolysing)
MDVQDSTSERSAQGFAAWISFGMPGRRPIDIVQRMSPADSEHLAIDGRAWALVACQIAETDSGPYQDGNSFCVIEGAPVTRSAEFGSLIEQVGIARACMIRYQDSGSVFLNELHGPFALALYSDVDQVLLLATDRLGVNPLFVARIGSDVAVATRLGQIARCPGLDLEIDLQGIFNYLYFHVIPGPRTIYQSVTRLRPGSFLELSPHGMREERYWEIEYTREQDRVDHGSVAAEFKALLRECVSAELHTGESVGCFLSGGTDSSTLCGVLSELTAGNAHSYSIGFDQQGYDEMAYARIAAKHFSTVHREYYVTPDDIVDLTPRIPSIYGEPFGNSSAVPTYYCARMAREDGVTRLLGGDGGDELFGGNERYSMQSLFAYYEGIPLNMRKYLIEPLLSAVPYGDRMLPVRKARRYIEQATVPMPDRLQTYNHMSMIGQDVMFDETFLEAVNPEEPIEMQRVLYRQARAQTMINKMLALDLKFTLTDNDLPKVGRMSEYAGVSVGYPFLNDLMLEFSARLPAHMKVRRLKMRYFFKKALRDFLPAEIISKSKHGFGLPFGDWLTSHKDLRELAFDSLGTLGGRGILRKEFLDDLRAQRIAEHAKYFGGLVWVLMMLELWFQQHEADVNVGRRTRSAGCSL